MFCVHKMFHKKSVLLIGPVNYYRLKTVANFLVRVCLEANTRLSCDASDLTGLYPFYIFHSSNILSLQSTANFKPHILTCSWEQSSLFYSPEMCVTYELADKNDVKQPFWQSGSTVRWKVHVDFQKLTNTFKNSSRTMGMKGAQASKHFQSLTQRYRKHISVSHTVLNADGLVPSETPKKRLPHSLLLK